MKFLGTKRDENLKNFQLQFYKKILKFTLSLFCLISREIFGHENETSKMISSHCVSTVSKWRGKSLFVSLCKSFFLDAKDVDSLGRFCAKRETLPSILLHVHFRTVYTNIVTSLIFINF